MKFVDGRENYEAGVHGMYDGVFKVEPILSLLSFLESIAIRQDYCNCSNVNKCKLNVGV